MCPEPLFERGAWIVPVSIRPPKPFQQSVSPGFPHRRGLSRLRIGQRIAFFLDERREQARRTNMPLINLVLILIVVGVGLWLINRFIPMASSIKTILNVVVVVAVCVWVLQAVGLWGDVTSFRLTN
jgi:predicted membrane protein